MESKIPKNKKILIIATGLVILLILGYLFFLKLSKKAIKSYQQKIIERIELATSRKIEIEKTIYSLSSIELKNIRISESSSDKEFLKIDKLKLDYDPYLIISAKKPYLTKMTIDKMSLSLKKEGLDRWNFQDISHLLGKDERPFYQRYTIEDLLINNSELLVKKDDCELFLANLNSEIKHIIGTAIFFLKTNFNLTGYIAKIPLTAQIKGELKTTLSQKATEFAGWIRLSNLSIDKLSISSAHIDLNYKKEKNLKLQADFKELTGFSEYKSFSEAQKNYERIFNKKLPNRFETLSLELSLTKEEFFVEIKGDGVILKSRINYPNNQHRCELTLLDIKASSDAKLFYPRLSSNSSETINASIVKVIKEIEHLSLIYKEVL